MPLVGGRNDDPGWKRTFAAPLSTSNGHLEDMALPPAHSLQQRLAIAMAMSSVQASSVSSLILYSRISSSLRHGEAACADTCTNCSRNGFVTNVNDLSTLSRRRGGSCWRLRRFSLSSNAQNPRVCGEIFGVGDGLCEFESADDLRELDRQLSLAGEERCDLESSRWKRRECLLAMAMVGGLAKQERARAEG